MFERPHHQAVAQVLASLDAAVLKKNHCYFGGGTAIALRYGEFRESVDIDFLVSDLAGYRVLRQLLTSDAGIAAIAAPGATLKALREIRADQYGIRTALAVGEATIKFEIVLEARITLEPPGPRDQIAGIATLTPLDLMCSKLLANSDRWADDAVFSRDLIDLAMMDSPKLLPAAIAKTSTAYGGSIQRDLAQAIARLREREGWMERCLQALKMNTPKARLWQGLQKLEAVLSAEARK